MSQKVKAKVVKKKKSFLWGKIWYYFKSLFSNGICLEIATSLKWFWSIIVFVLATLIAIIQPTVTASQIKGDQIFISQYSDPFYYGLNDYLNFVNNEDEEHENKDIVFNISTKQLEGTYKSDSYVGYISSNGQYNVPAPFYSSFREGKRILDIYVTNDLAHNNQDWLKSIAESNPDYGEASAEERKNMEDLKHKRTSSFIIFTNDKVYFALIASSGQVNSQINGNYNYILENFPKLKENGKATYTFADILGYEVTTNDVVAKQKQVIQNAGSYANKATYDTINTQTWVTFGIYAGVDGGIMIVMAFIVFAMTRGKNNPNRSTTLLQSFSIAFWMSITPALITLAFGFILPQFGPMLFLICYSFRIMFLSMKYLRPAV